MISWHPFLWLPLARFLFLSCKSFLMFLEYSRQASVSGRLYWLPLVTSALLLHQISTWHIPSTSLGLCWNVTVLGHLKKILISQLYLISPSFYVPLIFLSISFIIIQYTTYFLFKPSPKDMLREQRERDWLLSILPWLGIKLATFRCFGAQVRSTFLYVLSITTK